MKKTKILMPLVGVAAIGATVAPIVTLSSCHKNDYKLITDIKYGDREDKIGLLGSDELPSGTSGKAVFNITATLGKTWQDGHVLKHSWSANQPANMPLSIAIQSEEEVDANPGAGKEEYKGSFTILTNDTYKDKDQTLEVPVTYTEYESNAKDAKVIGKQVVTYKFQYFANRVSRVYIVNDTAIKAVANPKLAQYKTGFDLEGMTLKTKPADGLTLTMVASTWTLTDADNHVKLTIKEETTPTSTAINFRATLAPIDSYEIKENDVFKFEIAEELEIKFKDTEDKYVQSGWSQTVTTDKTITVTVKPDA